MKDETEKPKHQRRIPTEVEYHEKGQWKVNENIITIMGGIPNEPKQPIAHIRLFGYDDNKKPILAVLDTQDNELTERSSNLYQLKKYCLDHEQRLTKEMLNRLNPEVAHEEPVHEEPEIKQEIPEEKKENEIKAVRKSKTKDTTQTISH